MAEVVVFHHALGLTEGCQAFAGALRAAGHRVHSPDLYEGLIFDDLDDGIAHAEEVGFGTIIDRGRRAVEDLPDELVYAGFSLGVLPAQALTQTRPGARGALLLHSCIPAEEFGAWPAGVPVQIHTMEGDDLGDVDVARELSASLAEAELFLYPGEQHLFADPGLAGYDSDATSLLTERVLEFLDRVG